MALSTPAQHRAAIAKLVRSFNYKYRTDRIFSDAIEAAAIALDGLDLNAARRAQREERYSKIMETYDADERAVFPKILAELTMAMEAEPGDVLGDVFGSLELGNAAAGQFFTPFSVSSLMAQMTIGDGVHVRQLIQEKGFVGLSEPACGAGGMVIAYAQALRKIGINYQHYLCVTAVDVDSRAAHMAFVQFALMHIPAVVIVGNTLTLEEREHWFTPAYILGGWSRRLARTDNAAVRAAMQLLADEPSAEVPETVPVAAGASQERAGQLVLF